jgi:hypothetical protein
MKLAAWVFAVVLALYALHRLALWMESRGWVYYRKHKRGSAAMGSVMLEIQSFYRPSIEHVIEQKQEEQREEDDAGDPSVPGSRQRAAGTKLPSIAGTGQEAAGSK